MSPEQRWKVFKNLNIGDVVEIAISQNSNFLELDYLEQLRITDEIARNQEQTIQFIPNGQT